MASNARRQADWFFNKNTAPANYITDGSDTDETSFMNFGFQADQLKLKTAGTLQFSFDGKNDHGEILAADGFVDFSGAGKQCIYLKGGAAFTAIAWKEK